ncbi:Eukaryotic translation initiation factor 3 subunit H [Lamellibrachia satsuma]|nr:Eukaryotic translation initiation factor 3 subunit H [Lamellibrachia satsuma]
MAGRSDSQVEFVQLDGLVVLKMIKHCQEEGAGGMDLVQGVLLGLVENNRLEVTNCFPFPRRTEDDDFDEVTYQMEMMRNLRHVNVDHLHVGWYQSTYYGSFINKNFLDSQFNYQSSIEESIVLIYDPLRTAKGHLTLRALRLTPAVMNLYKEGDFSPESMKKSGVSFEKLFDEVPVIIKNSHLINATLCELDDVAPNQNKYNYLDLATSSVLEKNLHMMIDSIDYLNQDSNKFFNYQRQHAKQQQAKQQHILKRQQENAARGTRGEAALPEEDINKLFKPLQAPPRLDPLLWAGQVDSYAAQINSFSTQSFGKLFMAESLHKEPGK